MNEVPVAQACFSGLRLFVIAITNERVALAFSTQLCYLRYLMSRLRRIEDTDRIFFITTNLHPSARPLNPNERDIVLDWLGKVRTRYKFLLLGYVVMPDQPLLVPDILDSADPDELLMARAVAKDLIRVLSQDARACFCWRKASGLKSRPELQ